MALVAPMGHSREGGNPLTPENLDSRFRGSNDFRLERWTMIPGPISRRQSRNVTFQREGVDTFKDAMQDHGIDIGGKLMTYAQELLAEGEAKGRAEGQAEGRAEGEARKQVEMVEGFLRVGVTWEVIKAATGLTEADFQALKAQLPGADS